MIGVNKGAQFVTMFREKKKKKSIRVLNRFMVLNKINIIFSEIIKLNY